jgi:copper chaperone
MRQTNRREIEMLKLNVPDMTCGHCASTVTKVVKSVDAAAEVTIDLPSQTVTIGSLVDPAKFTSAMDAAGYPARGA